LRLVACAFLVSFYLTPTQPEVVSIRPEYTLANSGSLIPGPTGDDQLLHNVHQLDQGSASCKDGPKAGGVIQDLSHYAYSFNSAL